MKVFISGITGSLGSQLSKLLLENGHIVIGFSRDELKQQNFRKHKNLTLYLGDVRDGDRVEEATRDVEVIYHLAALKHVDKLEENPEEAIKTNVMGTLSILHAQRMNNVKRVVLSSTDKAVYTVNAYGASKKLAEKLVLRNPNNVVCRYGNVLASRGSFVGVLAKTLKEENNARITDANMTRFWITVEEASKFVMACGLSSSSGGLKIPTMKAAPLQLVAEAVAECLNISSYHTQYIGTRQGEKIHECLRSFDEGEEIFSNSAPQFTSEELVKIIRPIVVKS